MYSVIAIMDGIKSPAIRFNTISDAMAEAEACSRHIAQSAMVYVAGEPRPRCIYERGKLMVCRCPQSKDGSVPLSSPAE